MRCFLNLASRIQVIAVSFLFMANGYCYQPQTKIEFLINNERAKVNAAADVFLDQYFNRYPEKATYFGINKYGHAAFSDHSLVALANWQALEDHMLAQAKKINESLLLGTTEYITLQVLRNTIKFSKDERICRNELWPINLLTGWQVELADLARMQPVNTPSFRQQALIRWKQFPTVIDQEIENLTEGIRQGYTVSNAILPRIILQLDKILEAPTEDSVFFVPGDRDQDKVFRKNFKSIVANTIYPAVKKYRTFLQEVYLPMARTSIGVSANPAGTQCYQAKIQTYVTMQVNAKEIYNTGLHEIAKLYKELAVISKRSFGGVSSKVLLQEVKGSKYGFNSTAELLNFNLAALARAKAKTLRWFNMQPKAKVVIKPHPLYRAETGASAEFHPAARDGSRPGIFFINLYDPKNSSRVAKESTLFHETIPGHHLQTALAQELKRIHQISYYTQLWNAGYSEGWALYAERLADEMELYSSDLDRVGLISNALLRAARLVVDPGLHVFGWTKKQAIKYMLKNTAMSENIIQSEIDRYISMPGQATGYTLGMLEIMQLRKKAENELGTSFNIKEFHNEILKDGAMPLTLLKAKIEHWIQTKAIKH